MTMLYPIVLETEDSGAVSAYVPGLPVYAAAETHAKAERAIRALLTEYLHAHPATRPDARVRVARFSDRGKSACDPLVALRRRVLHHRRVHRCDWRQVDRETCRGNVPSRWPGGLDAGAPRQPR
jgi:hypothetical protein